MGARVHIQSKAKIKYFLSCVKVEPSIYISSCSNCFLNYNKMSARILALALILVAVLSGSEAFGSECGKLNTFMETSKGGTMSPLYYPWMVSISDKSGTSFCGGTLLDDRRILTAAHCLKGKSKDAFYVVLGVHNLSMVKVKDRLVPRRIKIHPDFKTGQDKIYENDLAIIEIDPVKFASNIRPICLSVDEESLNVPYIEATVLGWGQLSKSEEDMAQKLQQLTLNIVSNEVCGKLWNSELGSNKVCMGEPDKNICKGDGGGPLMMGDEFSGEPWVLIGVASQFGPVCGDKYPAIYTKILPYIDWINTA